MQFLTLFLALSAIARWLKRLRNVPDPPTVLEPSPRSQALEHSLPAVDRPPSPRRQPARGTAAWIPLSETVMVGGLTTPGGVYVGDTLAAVSQWGGTEPALINPSLSVDVRRPDVGGQQMGYWPAYAEISPSSRGAYLRWLESGRPGGAYVGYVFLFFYGIERRVIRDAANDSSARDEIPALLAEVERLRGLYRDNGSFLAYSTDFLATARFTGVPQAVADLTAPRQRAGWDIPLEVRLVAGAAAVDGEPLPGDWALAWALHSPEITLRKPATRCNEEFADLFLARYAAQHGDGLIIKPNKTKLRLQYRPASASFGGAIDLDAGDLPDVTRLSGPTNKLAALVASVTDDLDAYSRHVGRHDDRDSARAVALLPPELARERGAARVGRVLEALPLDGDHLVSAVSLADGARGVPSSCPSATRRPSRPCWRPTALALSPTSASARPISPITSRPCSGASPTPPHPWATASPPLPSCCTSASPSAPATARSVLSSRSTSRKGSNGPSTYPRPAAGAFAPTCTGCWRSNPASLASRVEWACWTPRNAN